MASVGDVIEYETVRYEIRAIVDGHYVVRIENLRSGNESYRLWTDEDRAKFDAVKGRLSPARKRAPADEKPMSDDKCETLATRFGLNAADVNKIFKR